MSPPPAPPAALRIGYVLKVFPRVSETFVINEIRAVEGMGTDVAIFSLHQAEPGVPHGVLRELRAQPSRVDALPAPDEARIGRTVRRLAARLEVDEAQRAALLPRKYVRLAMQLAELADAAGVRHLHAHFASRSGHVAALAAALLGGTYSVTAHAKDLYHRDVDPAVLRWKLARARLVVTVTDYTPRFLDGLLAETRGAPPVLRLYNGVDLARFHATAPPRDAAPLLLAVGRLVEKKGFDVLVDACALLQARGVAFRCEIIGGGAEEAALRARIAAAGLDARLTLRGVLPTEAVAARLADAAVVTLPCVVGADGNVYALPTVLLEAMACARPVVSTALSGIPEIVDDGVTGLLVPPRDAAALADALQALLTDPARAAALGRVGRSRAEERFDLHRNAAVLRDRLLAVVAAEAA